PPRRAAPGPRSRSAAGPGNVARITERLAWVPSLLSGGSRPCWGSAVPGSIADPTAGTTQVGSAGGWEILKHKPCQPEGRVLSRNRPLGFRQLHALVETLLFRKLVGMERLVR